MKTFNPFKAPSIRLRISSAFVLVTVLVVAMVTTSYLQLRQVRPFSDTIINNSSDLVGLQELSSATSALDADLERYLVIQGAEYRDNVQNDLTAMTNAVVFLQSDPIEGTENILAELETTIATLQEKVGPILDTNSANTSSADINRLIVTIYNDLDQVKLLQQELSTKTLTSLQATAQTQGQIAGSVSTQSVILGIIVALIAVATTLVTDRRLRTIGTLTDTAVAISGGDLSRVAPVESNDEIGTLAASFNTMTSQLQGLIGSLELRVADRTKALETSAEISRRLASILDPGQLAGAVVTEVQSAFDYYYAQIYLFDNVGENLVLTSGTGEAGAEMMKRGHSLPKGRGLVGRAAENNESILVADTSQNPDWLPNELLPDTKAEAAIPIAIGDKVLGILDVQDDVANDLSSEDVILLESLASQVAISIQNARQYAESQQFRLGIENSGDAVFATDTEGTITYANAAFEKVYGYSSAEVIGQNPRIFKSGLLTQENYEAFWGALLSKQSVTGDIVNKHKDGHLVYIAGTNSAIVNDAGKIIGFLAVHHDITEQKSSQDLISQRARQQEAINTITQRIQAATTIEEAMQVAARELGHALGQKQTVVALESSALGSGNKE